MTKIADLFCGAGGESTGIIGALSDLGHRYDLAAINHWDIALETHQANHPQARHFQSDLSHLNPLDVFTARDRVDLLWASPECTHHSNARGGRPRSNQSRASAWLILKWLSELYVRRVILENVPEFENWGPLGSDGKPLKSRRGDTFQAFVSAIQSLGYRVEWQNLCAADYGDPTTRKRFFLQAVRGHGRIQWPAPTHSADPDLFGSRPWVAARDIIDWSIRGESIVNRKRPLAEATLRRIEAGIRKYWGEWAKPFLVVLRGTSTTRDIDSPLPTVTAGGGHFGLVEPFLVRYHGNHAGKKDGERRVQHIAGPIGTLDTSNRYGLVQPFFVPFYGERQGQPPRTHGVDMPVPTIPASGGGKFGIVEPFILHQATPGRPRRIEEPVPTITSRSGHGLVEPFFVKYFGSADAQPIRVPIGALTTKDRYALVRGDVYALDITFRMLQPHELAAAQGFPRDYWFAGNRTEQVRQIGNAVPVETARALALSAFGAA